jgi:HrpA-like RNA helicase
LSFFSVDSPFFVPRGKREESGTAHKTFKSFHGDHLTLLNVYKAYVEAGESKEWCTGHYLKPAVLVKARKVRNQLSDLLNKSNDKNTGSNSLAESGSAANTHGNGGVGVDESTVEVTDEPEAVLRALASAFFLQTAQRSNRNGDQRRKGGRGDKSGKQEREAPYALTANGIGVNLHPSSSLFNRQPLPEWVVYHEVVRSSKMYLRGVSAVPKDLLLKEAPQFYKSKSMVDEGVKRKEEQEKLVKRRRRAALMCG